MRNNRAAAFSPGWRSRWVVDAVRRTAVHATGAVVTVTPVPNEPNRMVVRFTKLTAGREYYGGTITPLRDEAMKLLEEPWTSQIF